MIDTNLKGEGEFIPPLFLPRTVVFIKQEVNGVYSLYR